MDKYLLIMLIVLTMGMGFAIFKEPPSLELFYAQWQGRLLSLVIQHIRNEKLEKALKSSTKDLDRSPVPSHGIACKILGIVFLLV